MTLLTEGGCTNPGSPAHGRMVGSDFSYNSVVRYECNEGYILVGSEERRCQADGQWSCEQPRCLTAGTVVLSKGQNVHVCHGLRYIVLMYGMSSLKSGEESGIHNILLVSIQILC